MDINLCGGDAFVTEHLLDCPEIGATLKQVGGKGVPQCVGTHRLADAGKGHKILDDVEHHHARQTAATTVEKQHIGASAPLGHKRAHLLKIGVDPVKRHARHRHQALLAALAVDYHIFLLAEHSRQTQPRELAHTQSAPVQNLKNGTVAYAQRR